tara:strand:- start:4609 stop:4893 length:285 start_codon:yes stop_codon:yes gene_type:complete
VNILLLVLCVLLLSIPNLALAQADPTSVTNKTEKEVVKDVEPDSDKKENQTRRSSEPAPEADRLKERDLGDAFRRFVPSEAISADNAVPFPVDI